MVCPACGAPNAERARFCDQCGTRLAPDDGPLLAGDRRLVTAVFADLVDYSRLVAELDPEEVRVLVEAALGQLARAVERYGGTIEKFIGDAVFAVFGSPVARDDDAVRAALCAQAMRDGLAQAGPADRALHLRVGVATGEVVAAPRDLAGQRGLAFTGQAITTAARLQQLAAPDEIVVHQATVDAARGELLVEPFEPDPRAARAGPKTIARDSLGRLYHLAGVRTRPRRHAFDDPFIGRAPERRVLRDALRDAGASGRGRVVVVVGDAGMGKTRLVAELEADARAAGFAWTWSDNASYRSGEPYAHTRLVAERLGEEHGRDAGGFARDLLFEEGAGEEVVRRMSGAIAAIAREAEFSGWEDEQALVPTDPDRVMRDLGELAERYIRRLVERHGPRVVVIDDIHWMDPSSGFMTDRLMRAAAGLPLVVVATSRPARLPAWSELGHVRVLRLEGLDEPDTSRLARSVARLEIAPRDARRLHDRTAGNPLFIRETVRTLLTDGAAVSGGRLRIAEGQGGLPVTLRAVLGARIDALSAAARERLQVASVCGLDFEAALVERLLARERAGGPADPPATAPAAEPFEQLGRAGLVEPVAEPGAWRFAHPLIHDVAYASLLGTRRRRLHAILADVLEERGDRFAVGLLARHRAAARDVERAIPLLELAADEAFALGAREEAAGFMELAAGLALDAADRARYAARAAAFRSGRAKGERATAGGPRGRAVGRPGQPAT